MAGNEKNRARAADAATPTAAAAAANPVLAGAGAEQITGTIDEIFFAASPSVLELTCGVGETVVRRLFKGRLEEWRAGSPGSLAVAQVAAGLRRRGSDWTSARLHRAVRVYEQHEAFGGFGEWPRLTANHFVEVHGLPFEQQKKLLTTAQQESWDLRQLRAAIDSLRARASKVARQTAVADATRVLEALGRLLDEEALETNLALGGIARENVERLQQACEACQAEVDSLRDLLGVGRSW